jgi:hypothetical protein
MSIPAWLNEICLYAGTAKNHTSSKSEKFYSDFFLSAPYNNKKPRGDL